MKNLMPDDYIKHAAAESKKELGKVDEHFIIYFLADLCAFCVPGASAGFSRWPPAAEPLKDPEGD